MSLDFMGQRPYLNGARTRCQQRGQQFNVEVA
jgi:hypothetical protein